MKRSRRRWKRLSQSSTGIFFDEFADKFDTFYDGKRSRPMRWIDGRFRRDMFIRYELTFQRLGDLQGKSVLDIGCGSGPYVAEALARGAEHVTGIDPAQRMLQLTEERVSKLRKVDPLMKSAAVTLIQGYFPETAPGQSADYAIVMGVMDYVAEPSPFLKKLREFVRAGAAVSFPSSHWFRTPLRSARYRLRKVPLTFYTAEKIRALAGEAGYSGIELTKIAGSGQDYFAWLQ